MASDIFKYIVKPSEAEWVPLTEEGVDTKGIYLKTLTSIRLVKSLNNYTCL